MPICGDGNNSGLAIFLLSLDKSPEPAAFVIGANAASTGSRLTSPRDRLEMYIQVI